MEDNRLNNLAEFMYLSFSQSLWEGSAVQTSSWSELDDYQREAWLAAALTAYDYLVIPEPNLQTGS